jgi:hypothetical protein
MRCIQLLETGLLPQCNLFCYGQVKSHYGSGEFIADLEENLGGEEKLVTSEIADIRYPSAWPKRATAEGDVNPGAELTLDEMTVFVRRVQSYLEAGSVFHLVAAAQEKAMNKTSSWAAAIVCEIRGTSFFSGAK